MQWACILYSTNFSWTRGSLYICTCILRSLHSLAFSLSTHFTSRFGWLLTEYFLSHFHTPLLYEARLVACLCEVSSRSGIFLVTACTNFLETWCFKNKRGLFSSQFWTPRGVALTSLWLRWGLHCYWTQSLFWTSHNMPLTEMTSFAKENRFIHSAAKHGVWRACLKSEDRV
jgi:hypothetical protein